MVHIAVIGDAAIHLVIGPGQQLCGQVRAGIQNRRRLELLRARASPAPSNNAPAKATVTRLKVISDMSSVPVEAEYEWFCHK